MKESKKYVDILNSAKDLFWKYGFKRVSVEEVCREANVSKMTFYKYFSNKIELAKVVLEKEIRKGMNVFRINMNEDTTADEKVKKMLVQKLQNSENVSSEFLLDFYKSEEFGLKTYMEELMQKVWMEVIDEFKMAQKRGIFRKDLNMELFFAFAMKSIDLITDEKFLKQYYSPKDLILELSNLIVYGIVPHDT